MTAQHPYENFRFRMKCNGDHVAGVSTVGGLNWTDDGGEHREGGNPAAIVDAAIRTKCPAITLERGITFDAEFASWATKAWSPGSALDAAAAPKNIRKNLVIDVFDEAGQLAVSYKVYGAWVSEFQALPDLDANANAVAIQHIKIEHEGIVRDDAS